MPKAGQGQKEKGRLGGRLPCTLLNLLFAALLAAAVVLVTLLCFAAHGTGVLVAFAAGVAGIVLLARLFSLLPVPGRLAEAVLVVLLFAAFAGFRGWAMLQPYYNGQPFPLEETARLAQAYVLQGAAPPAPQAYAVPFSGPYMLYVLFFGALKAFGVFEFALPVMVLQQLCLASTLLLTYLCARRVLGSGKALFVLLGGMLLCLFLLPPSAGLPLGLVLPVPVGMALVWLKARSLFLKDGRSLAGRFCWLSVLGAVGALLCPAVLLVWLAIAIDLLVQLRGKGRMGALLGGTLLLLVLFAGGLVGIWFSPAVGLPSFYVLVQLPLLVVLGFGFAIPVWLANPAQLAAGGVDNLLPGLESPGAFFAGGYWQILQNIGLAMLAGILVWAAVAALKAIYRKNNAFTFLRLALVLLAAWMLFTGQGGAQWLPFAPLLLLCALEAAPPWRRRRKLTVQRARPKRRPAVAAPKKQKQAQAAGQQGDIVQPMPPEDGWQKKPADMPGQAAWIRSERDALPTLDALSPNQPHTANVYVNDAAADMRQDAAPAPIKEEP